MSKPDSTEVESMSEHENERINNSYSLELKEFIQIGFLRASQLLTVLILIAGCQSKVIKNDESLPKIPTFQDNQVGEGEDIDNVGPDWARHPEKRFLKEFKELDRIVDKEKKDMTLKQKLDSKVRWSNFYYELGKKSLQNKVGSIAVKAFKKCLYWEPKNSDCHWELGWAEYLEHQYLKSLKQFQWIEKNQPLREGIASIIKKVKYLNDIRTQSLQLKKKYPHTYQFSALKKNKMNLVKLRAVGDTMIGSWPGTASLPPHNQSPLELVYSELKETDVLFANYEGTFCDQAPSSKCTEDNLGLKCFAFATPTSYIAHIKKVGFNLISLANNHIMDFGETCRLQTENTLTENNIAWSGRQGSVARIQVIKNTDTGTRVQLINSSDETLRKSQLKLTSWKPQGVIDGGIDDSTINVEMGSRDLNISMIAFHSSDHSNSTLNLSEVESLIQIEKSQNRFVIVSFHGGAEGIEALHLPKPPKPELFYGENRGNVVEFAHKAIDSGADVVLGSGPHVLRGMELYKEKLIAYSLGNFSTYKQFNLWGLNGIGAILELYIDTSGRVVSGKIVPTKQIYQGVPIFDDKQEGIDILRWVSIKDFPKNHPKIARDGSFLITKRNPTSEVDEQSENTEDVTVNDDFESTEEVDPIAEEYFTIEKNETEEVASK